MHYRSPPPLTPADQLEDIYWRHFTKNTPDQARDLLEAALRDGGTGAPGAEQLAALCVSVAEDLPELQSRLRRLALVSTAAGILDRQSRAAADEILSHHAGFIVEVNRKTGSRTVVFVAKSPYFVILRAAIYLRKNGFRTFLLTLYPIADNLRELFHANMDGFACANGSHFGLRAIMEALTPDVFHVQCWMLSYELGRMAAEVAGPAAVICDFYDLTSVYAPRDALCTVWSPEVVDTDFAHENYILHNADAVLSRYTDEVMENWGDRFGSLPPYFSMQAFSLPEYVVERVAKAPVAGRQPRLVYAGGVIPTWLNPALFPEVYMPKAFEALLKQGLAIDVLHDPARPINEDPVYAPFRYLQERYPHFRLIDGVSPDRLPTALSAYDFGILLCDFPQNLSITPDQKRGVMATKIYAYLEAGLPVLVNAEYLHMASLVEQNGVGMAVSSANMARVAESIASFDFEGAAGRIARFNEEFGMHRQIHRLIDIYERAAARAPGRQEKVAAAAALWREELRAILADITDLVAAHHVARGESDLALACLRKAAQHLPRSAGRYASISRLLRESGRFEEAEAACQASLSCDARQAEPAAALVALSSRFLQRPPSAIQHRARNHAGMRQGIDVPKRRGRLRLGLVAGNPSAGLNDFLLAPILANLDPQDFDVYGYFSGDASQSVALCLSASANARTIDVQRHADAVRTMDQDDLDLAIDLCGQDAPEMLAILGTRVAPVQALWSLLPVPTGLAAMDYVIADDVMIAAAEETRYAERLLRLSRPAWLFAPAGPAEQQSRRSPTFVLTVLGDWRWLFTPMADVVGAILRAVPQALFVLPAGGAASLAALQGSLERHGLPAHRFRFEAATTGEELVSHGTWPVALALDPFPLSTGRQCCSVLWHGVPVLAMAADTQAGRVAPSVLSHLGLAPLIAPDPQGYTRQAIALMADPGRRQALSGELRWRLADSELMDRPAFAAALRAILDRLGEAALAAPRGWRALATSPGAGGGAAPPWLLSAGSGRQAVF